MERLFLFPALLALLSCMFFPAGLEARSVRADSLSGVVRSQTGLPVEAARVRVSGAQDFVLTDKNGRFELPLSNPRMKWFEFFVTAGKEGWLNGGSVYRPGTKELSIVLQVIPQVDFKDYPFMITSPAGPVPQTRGMMAQRDCGNCHTTHLWEWGASKMGKTALNQRVVENYRQFMDQVGGQRANTCADCHLPIATLDAPGQTDLERALQYNQNLSKGIECDFCHKIRDVEVSNKPGVQAVSMTRVSLGSGMMSPMLAYGPYDDVVTMPMAASYNTLYSKSEFCSSCHQDGYPLAGVARWNVEEIYPEAAQYPLYENGRIMPNQWTYQEWLEWQDNLPDDDEDKGRQCQNCHMNWTKEMVPYYRHIVSGRVRDMGLERDPKNIFPHKFEGATPSRLQGAVHLQVEGDTDDDTLTVTVGVTNVNAGHRLPTGEHTRNMILLVEAEDEAGNRLAFKEGSVVPEWGGSGQDEGDYAGRPGHGFARITEDADGNINVPVWRATSIRSDNRIKAKQTDATTYAFDLPVDWQEDDPIYVTTRLIYRSDFKTDVVDGNKLNDIIMQEKYIEVGNGGL